MEKWKSIIKNLLLAFVLVSVGYAIGKNTSSGKSGNSFALQGNPETGKHLVVYYTHATMRCETCNNIEKKTHELLESKFKDELASGNIKWQVVNFQEDESFAKKFDVTTSGVIAVSMDGDKVINYERLDDVWTLLEDPPAFDSYLEKSFRKLLAEPAGGAE